MKATIRLGIAALAVALGAAAVPAAGHAGTVHVTVSDYEFDPAVLDIAVGTRVEWKNVGPSMHEVSFHLHNPVHAVGPHDISTSTTGTELMVMLEAGESFAYEFDEAGVYLVNCNLGGLHEGMKQVIRVSG